MVNVPRPAAVQALSGTMEAMVAALEMQRANDHAVINALADAIMGVQTGVQQQASAIQELTQTGLELRQHVHAARSDLAAGISGANEAAQGAAMAQKAVTV